MTTIILKSADHHQRNISVVQHLLRPLSFSITTHAPSSIQD